MKKIILLVILIATGGCSTSQYALNPEYSIMRAGKKFTMFFANCREARGADTKSDSGLKSRDMSFRERASVLVRYLRNSGFNAFHVDQVSNVVVTVGQFNEAESSEAQRMIFQIKSHPRLRVLKTYWRPRKKNVRIAGNPALSRGYKLSPLNEQRRKPFRMLGIDELKSTVGVKKQGGLIGTKVLGPPPKLRDFAK